MLAKSFHARLVRGRLLDTYLFGITQMQILKTPHLRQLFIGAWRLHTPLWLASKNLSPGGALSLNARSARTRRAKSLSVSSLIILLSCFSLVGCWSNKDKSLDTAPVELRSDSAPLSTEVPESELANLSKRLYQSSMYTVARDSLNSLKDRYPLGPYAMLAELKYADSYYFNGEYNEAAIQYESFAKNHPESPESMYAKLQAARSHAHSAKTDGRDRTPWERSLTLYNDLVKTNTGLAQTATLERAAVIEELKAYDREIMAFYEKNKNKAAVVAREAAFKRRWASEPNTTQAAKVRNKYATLDSNRPTIKLLPLALRTPLPKLYSTPNSDSLQASSDSTTEIVGISCSDTPVRYIAIEVTKLPQRASELLGRDRLLRPDGGSIVLPNLLFSSDTSTWSCHDQTSASLDTEGRLSLPADGELLLSAIENPPRLLLSSKGASR